MSLDIDAFTNAVTLFVKAETPKQAILAHKKIVLEAFRRVILKTPVDTGRARMGWMLTINSPTDAVPPAGKYDSPDLTGGLAAISTLGFAQVVWLSNNVEYIGWLEEGRPGPGSPQAPNGMLAVTLVEIQNGL